MTARRALTEVTDEQLAIGTAPRRSMGVLDEQFDDTLVSVSSSSAAAFEPVESLRTRRELPKLSVTAPSFLRNRAGLQRSIIGVAAFASAGAALIIPQAANAKTAISTDIARTDLSAIVTRDTQREAATNASFSQAANADTAAANAYLSAAADADAASAEAFAAQLAAAQAAVAAGEQQVADKVEADRKAAEEAAAQAAAQRAAASRAATTSQTTNSQPATSQTAPATNRSPVNEGAAASAAEVSVGTAPSAAGQSAISVAMAQVGKNYVWGAVGPNTFDCSGLMVYAFRQAGVSLPRTSYSMMGVGSSVSLADIQPGDLVISYGGGHVGLYIGNGMMVHAANEQRGVEVSSLQYYSIDTIRRIG